MAPDSLASAFSTDRKKAVKSSLSKTAVQVGETNSHVFKLTWIIEAVLALFPMQQCCLPFYQCDVVLELTTLSNTKIFL